jgi:TfoX/Sxy family transcriptional regulator of competence genes
MSTVVFNEKHKEVLDALLLQIPGVVAGRMFGYPAYYTGRKLFACIYEDGVGLKVPEKIADSLVGQKGIVRFQPMGRRPMKEWIQINREHSEDYRNDQEILKISIEYVSAATK